MDGALHHVTDWLLDASSKIAEPYFRLPVAGGDPKYRERVYCYELYHQWRRNWPEDFPFMLCGETDKRGHIYIQGENLDNTKPDFIAHFPGRMTNLLVMEVKSSNGTIDQIVEDLKKLTAYRRDVVDKFGNPACYFAAYFWIYGMQPDLWPELRNKICEHTNYKDVDSSLIRCFVHQNFNKRAVEVNWE